MEKCPECGAVTEKCDGPTHAYMTSSPGCWKVFGDVLAKEYSDQEYWKVHRLTVDSYACQHGGDTSRAIQSVNVHLCALYLAIERKLPFAAFSPQMKKVITKFKSQFVALDPPDWQGVMKVTDVSKAKDAAEHCLLVQKWAEEVWQAWEHEHRRVKSMMRFMDEA